MKTNHSHRSPQPAADSAWPSTVLYGLDEHGKPRAASFSAKEAALAKKAAGLMNVKVLNVAGPPLSEIVAKLPSGRLYSSGRGLVPNIRGKLYAQLIEAANGSGAAGSQNGSSGGRWPPLWSAVETGQVVIAQETEKEMGWSEAMVVGRNGDMFTLRWKEPPNKKLITRHRINLALPCSPQIQRDLGKASTASAHTTPQKSEPSKNDAPKQAAEAGVSYPGDWAEIDVGHLVLAKEDGPLQGWWEAVVTAKLGESFTLQWRDHASLPTIIRSSERLALICPTKPPSPKSE
jgi:hypothetical protein